MTIKELEKLDNKQLQEKLAELRNKTRELRFNLAQKAFAHTAVYDRNIAEYLGSKSSNDVKSCYKDF